MPKYKFIIATLSLILATGCGSIVKKPEINSVKKIAILSVYANDKVVEAKGRGFVKGWKSNFKMQVADDLLKIHKKTLRSLGWRVMDPDKVLTSKAYKKAFKIKRKDGKPAGKTMKFLASIAKNIHRNKFFSPAGMFPVQFTKSNKTCYGNGCKISAEQRLAAFAKKLKVDAVAVVQVDFCYQGGTWTSLGGAGQAFMTAGTSVKMVNKKGVVVLNTPSIAICGDNKYRRKSKSSTGMSGGNLMVGLTKKTTLRRMFKESARASARSFAAHIRKEL